MKKLLLAVLAITVIGCSSDKDDAVSADTTFVENPVLGNVRRAVVNHSDIPQWLVDRIEVWEKDYKRIEIPSVFRGELNDSTIYYIYSPLYSCIFCTVYFADGSNVDVTTTDPGAFKAATKNWVCIYEGNKLY